MVIFVLFAWLQFSKGVVVTTDDKISWVLPGVSEEYANSLKYRYYIGASKIGVDIKDVKCVRTVPNERNIKCTMPVPTLMAGTYQLFVTSEDPSVGVESEKAPYVITIVPKPPMPTQLQKE